MADALRIQVGAPSPPSSLANVISFTNFVLNQATDALEFIFQVDEAVTIPPLGFRYGARTGTPPAYQISLQGVDGTGLPDGVIKGATNNCLAIFTPPADTTIDGLWQWKATSESYAAARGEFLAIVIAYSSGTVDASNNSSFTSVFTNSSATRQAVPYSIQNDNGSRTRQTGALPAYGFKTASATYGFVLQSVAATAYSSNSTPDERALKFTLPAAWGDTFQVVGIEVFGTAPAASKTVLITLYDGTTPLQTYTWDGDVVSGAAANRTIRLFFDEATLATLSYGATYRVGFAPQETSANLGIEIGTQAASTDWQGWSGGESFALSTRTDAGAWTDDALSRPWIDLILKDITEPAGGGGGMLVHPGMSGGIR